MRIRVTASPSRLLGNAALVVLITATAAGCSTSDRFASPLFTGSTENQREIIGGNQPMPPPVAGSQVTRSDLPPPGPAMAAAAPAPTTGSNLPPGSYEWTPNGVQPSGTPTTVSTAPVAAPSRASGGTHVVAYGDTVYSIGRQYGVRPNDIVAANGLSDPGNIRVGQRLTVPGAGSQRVAAAAPPPPPPTQVAALNPPTSNTLSVPTAPKPTTVAEAGPRVIPGIPSIPVETKSNMAPTIPASTAVDDVVEPPSADGTSFRWPVRGRIISGFGAKPSGQRNDGINLAVPEGTTVKAAEAGTVIYAGNELEGYGNLVLIRHADEWVSAYAHNSDIKVKKGDTVRRGQTIATAGMSGSVTSPQVHFELRKKAKPVNPLDYLAGA